MKKLIVYLIASLISSCSYAATVTITPWVTGDTVTAARLNSNNTAITSQLNGGIDNTNISSSYKLLKTVASLDPAGTQGTVEFLTSDNSLNLDTGAAWVKAITPSGTPATGMIPYYNSSWSLLSPGAQYLPLVSNGTTSLPTYQTLSTHAGGTGQDFSATAAGLGLYFSSTGTLGTVAIHGVQIFTSNGTFTAPTGITKVYITAVGGGGGGGSGGSGAGGAGGGGGGAMVINYPYTVIAGNSYSVTIGAAGTGASGSGGASGSTGGTGGTTIFDALNIPGGNGGNPNSGSTNGDGGAGGGGYNAGATVTTQVQTGGLASLAGGNGAKANAFGGGGGGTIFGAGASGGNNNFSGSSAAVNSGGGGGGGGGANAATGGNGGTGLVIVIY